LAAFACQHGWDRLDRTPQQQRTVVAAYLSDDFAAPMPMLHGWNSDEAVPLPDLTWTNKDAVNSVSKLRMLIVTEEVMALDVETMQGRRPRPYFLEFQAERRHVAGGMLFARRGRAPAWAPFGKLGRKIE
jgi:hypothetical protein